MRAVFCPSCRKPSEWNVNNTFRPFCSQRCKQIDLAAWADGSYRIAGQEQENQSSISSDFEQKEMS
jgi:endogenous inhibitor of DNA gyrase (YacG/DUF329 family)